MRAESFNAAFSSGVRTIQRPLSSSIFGVTKPKLIAATPSKSSSNFLLPLHLLLWSYPLYTLIYHTIYLLFFGVGFTRISIRCAVHFRPCIDIHKVLQLEFIKFHALSRLGIAIIGLSVCVLSPVVFLCFVDFLYLLC